MNDIKRFIDRIHAGVRPDQTSLVRFITEETNINLKPYSFLGHEFQQYFVELIEKDPNIDITAEKCSQIGLSEICFRIVLGKMALFPGYSVIYAMPSKSFAMEVLKTRMSPIIDNSPQLSSLISREVDSASVKMFMNGSILFALGASAQSSQSLINRPVVLALTDELDKCDYDTHTGLRSRQTHSLMGKPRIAISTPTVPGIGINAQAEGRQIHYQIVICSHCGHDFIPDYYEQVKLPGYDEPISTLTNEKMRSLELDTDNAYHHCPKCHKSPDLTPPHRRWVVDNPEVKKVHLRLSPFDAPSFITPTDLVTSQLTYSSRAEFDNQSLGLPCKLENATIDQSSVEFFHDDPPTGIPIGGLDLGRRSNFMKGIFKDNIIYVTDYEEIELPNLEHHITHSIISDRLVSVVSDSLPFLDVVHRLANKHPMFWGAVYSVPTQPRPELYKLKVNSEEQVRQIDIQKNLMMDHVASLIVNGQIKFKSSPFDAQLLKHFMDMRRVRDHRYSDLRYKWMKSNKGVDHWWHALIYLVSATKIFTKTANSAQVPMEIMLQRFKQKVEI